MKIENQHGVFLLCEAPTRLPNEVGILVDGCRHVVQDGPLAERDSETGELTPKAMNTLGNIVLEDHLEFCLGHDDFIEIEFGITTDLMGES